MSWVIITPISSIEQGDSLLLALQSQGLEGRILTNGSVSLAVPEAQVEAARRLLRELATDAPPAESTIPVDAEPEELGKRSGMYWLFGLMLINGLVWWVMEGAGGSESTATLMAYGAIHNDALANGQWWRLISAVFVHIGPRHLLGNTMMLLFLGWLALRQWGPGRMLSIYILSGALGNVAGLLFGSPTAIKAGASGAILGLLGAFAATRVRSIRRARGRSRYRAWHVLAMLVAFYGMAVGVKPDSDHVAHIGGIISGGLLTLILPWPGALSAARERRLQSILGVIAFALGAGALVAAWLNR